MNQPKKKKKDKVEMSAKEFLARPRGLMGGLPASYWIAKHGPLPNFENVYPEYKKDNSEEE